MVEEKQDDTVNARDVLDRAEAKNEEFRDLLEKIQYASKETKKIWKEIYENAVDDRTHAFLLFADLYRFVANNEKGHVDHGRQISMYIERMNKANDQLLKLAELVENAKQDDEAIDAGALYEEFNTK
jgi:hypothetical protein